MSRTHRKIHKLVKGCRKCSHISDLKKLGSNLNELKEYGFYARNRDKVLTNPNYKNTSHGTSISAVWELRFLIKQAGDCKRVLNDYYFLDYYFILSPKYFKLIKEYTNKINRHE